MRYDDGSSPTASTILVMIKATLAANLCNAVAYIDFSGAFLNASMPDSGDHMVHMSLNKLLTQVLVNIYNTFGEFVEPDGTFICMLNRALYGTIAAARLQYDMFVPDAIKFGYEVNEVDVHSNELRMIISDSVGFIRVSSEAMIDRIIKQ